MGTYRQRKAASKEVEKAAERAAKADEAILSQVKGVLDSVIDKVKLIEKDPVFGVTIFAPLTASLSQGWKSRAYLAKTFGPKFSAWRRTG